MIEREGWWKSRYLDYIVIGIKKKKKGRMFYLFKTSFANNFQQLNIIFQLPYFLIVCKMYVIKIIKKHEQRFLIYRI